MKIIRYFFILIIGAILIITIPINITLLTLNQSVLKPYSSIEYFEKANILGEFKKILNVGNNKYVEEKWLEEKFVFVQKELWDYITYKDDKLEEIDMTEIENKAIENAKKQMVNIPQEQQQKAIEQMKNNIPNEFNWEKNINKKQLEKFREIYYYQEKALMLLNVLNVLLIMIKMLLIFNVKKSMKWISNVAIISGITGIIPYIFLKAGWREEILKNSDINGTAIGEFINIISTDVITKYFYNSALILGIGIVLLVSASILKKNA